MTREERRRLAETPPAWMYEFDLGDGILTPLLGEELRQVHRTRESMILPALEECFPEGLAGWTVWTWPATKAISAFCSTTRGPG